MNNVSRFSQRAQEEELMDDLNCSGDVVDQTLRELEVINKWLGGNNVTLEGVKTLLQRCPTRKVILADVGCGGGDIMVLLAKWARKRSCQIKFLGIDANPNIIAIATHHTSAWPEIEYECMDILSAEFRQKTFDIVTATLFFHHFSSDQLSYLLRTLIEKVRIGIVINDIHRHWFAYHSIKLLTRAFSSSPMVINDAPLSVLRSFSKSDWESILSKAGIKNYTIKWRWAFRWQIIITP